MAPSPRPRRPGRAAGWPAPGVPGSEVERRTPRPRQPRPASSPRAHARTPGRRRKPGECGAPRDARGRGSRAVCAGTGTPGVGPAIAARPPPSPPGPSAPWPGGGAVLTPPLALGRGRPQCPPPGPSESRSGWTSSPGCGVGGQNGPPGTSLLRLPKSEGSRLGLGRPVTRGLNPDSIK